MPPANLGATVLSIEEMLNWFASLFKMHVTGSLKVLIILASFCQNVERICNLTL